MENKKLSWIVTGYKSIVGEFDFGTLIYLVSVLAVTIILPFTRPGFQASDISFWFILLTVGKIGINVLTKRKMAWYAIRKGLITKKEIVDADADILKARKEIETNKYNKYLPRAVREENFKVDLDTLYDKINDEMAKTDSDDDIVKLSGKLEKIEETLDKLEKHEDVSKLRNALLADLSNIKRSKLTVASLYSKNDTVKRARQYEVILDDEVNKMTLNSVAFSLIVVAAVNLMTFFQQDADINTLVQAVANTFLLVYSGVMGIDGGNKILDKYVKTIIEKLQFLLSFIIKAKDYGKKTPDEQKQEDDDKNKEAKEKEIRKLAAEAELQVLARANELEDKKLDQAFILEKLKIESETKQAEAVIAKANQPRPQDTSKIELVVKTEEAK
jgi:hypothetical protein